MRELAARTDSAVAGSIATFEGGEYFNRFWFVRPDGSAEHYDKKHLFGREKASFTPGGSRVVVEWRGVRYLLAVCYDLRFPTWLRCRSDYDAILICASWPDARRYAWDTLLRARAIENLCYVAAVNRVGEDPGNSYSGGSVLLDPLGAPVCACPDSQSCVCEATLDLSAVTSLRASFPALSDAD